jgi:oligoendopeptidase F
MSSVPERDQISEEYKWDLEKTYANIDEWEDDFEQVKQTAREIENYRGEVTNSPSNLLEVLEKRDGLLRKLSKLRSFASMRSDEDKRDQDAQALKSRAENLSSEVYSSLAFIEPEIQEVSSEELDEMIEQEGGLSRYGHYFDDLMRLKPHTRSEEVEELLADLSGVLSGSGDTYSFLMNADLSFPTVEKPSGEETELTISNFTKLQKNPDREFRRDVYEKFYDRLAGFRNTVSTTLENNVRKQVKMASQRNYGSAREASLKSSNIPTSVYDNLVDTVKSNLDVLHDHVRLKQEALDVEELGMHDIYVPLVEGEPEIKYEDAKEHILEALQPLGDEYVEKVREGLESGWVDVYENKGKRSGAYSGGAYDTHPYILMNYQDDIQSMYTLAHELGHSMHSYYTTDEQPYVYSDYELFVAEVASTTNEALLTKHLLENVEDENFRAHVLSHVLEDYRNTLFRQTMFADFEQAIHREVEEGGALTPDRIDELYGRRKEKFYAPADVDDRIRREWMRIPHFYYNFYVYQYSTGISAATALSERIIESEDNRDDYIEFLKSGSRKYPLQLLRLAGVDMESPEPVQEAIDVYSDYIEQMRQYVVEE